jgi:hypothetical protein
MAAVARAFQVPDIALVACVIGIGDGLADVGASALSDDLPDVGVDAVVDLEEADDLAARAVRPGDAFGQPVFQAVEQDDALVAGRVIGLPAADLAVGLQRAGQQLVARDEAALDLVVPALLMPAMPQSPTTGAVGFDGS